MGTLLPPEILDTVLQQFPCRQRQIYELAILYNDGFPPPSTLVAYGIEPTHKLDVITAVLGVRQVRHAIVRCAECVSPRHLLNKIFTACLTLLGRQDEADEYDRIDSVNALAINLERLFRKQEASIVLVLDQLDSLMSGSQMLVAALVRFPDMVPSMSLLLTTASPTPLPLSHSGIPCIHFPPYTRLEAVRLIAQQDVPLPSFEHDCNIDSLQRTWQSFVVTVYDSLAGPTSASFPRFEEICHKLWPRFIWPALSGQAPPGRCAKWDYGLLLVKNRMLFQTEGEEELVDKLHRRSRPLTFDTLHAQTVDEVATAPSTPSKRRLSAPRPTQPSQSAGPPMLKHFSTILLLSAYLASHTPPKQDIILFSRLSSASTTKSGKIRRTPKKSPFKSQSRAAAAATTPTRSDGGTGGQGGWREQKMAARTKNVFDVKFGAPKAFAMERLLAIVRAIHPDGVARTKGVSDRIYREMGELQRLRLVTCLDDERGGRWRINVGREWVVDLAQAHGLTVTEWEMEEISLHLFNMMISMKQPFLGLQGTRLQIAVGVLAGLDFLLFGYDQGVTGGLLTLDSFRKQFPTIDAKAPNISQAQASTRSTYQGISVASYNLGCFLGAVACIWVGNPLGRRRAIFVGTSIMIVGAILQAASYHLPLFIVGRIVTGIGNGLNTSTVPTWQSECSRSHRRGQLVMIEGALITCGIMIAYWIDFALYFTDPHPVSWRFPLAFQIVFCLPILAFVMHLPESPRWLILKGLDEEAVSVLAALNGQPRESEFVRDEFQAIADTVLEESKGSFRDLFTMGENKHFHRVVLGYVNQMFQQISGINLITYYIPNVLENQVGLSSFNAKLIAACNGTEYFIASWIAVFTIEKIGRRKLMLWGVVGMSICMAILAGTDSIGSTKSGIAETIFLFMFNTCFAVGWLGMTWLYPAEIVPLKIRAPANALSTTGNWIWNFMVVMITPVAFSSIKYHTYTIFAVINAAIFPIVYFFYPETAYRSLEEMDAIFQKSTVWTVVKVADREPHRFDKHGKALVKYEETEQARRASVVAAATGRRRSSALGVGSEKADAHQAAAV
ncbi:hypothetical protein DV735_g1882, partial [Chaetothyriales sp. CBS 134920]